MSWADIKNFLQIYFGVILVVAILGIISDRTKIDRLDHLHAMIIAGVSTMCRAIHTQGKGED